MFSSTIILKNVSQKKIKNKLNNENNIKKFMSNQRIKDIKNCRECFYKEINFYCRYCNKFVCEKFKDKNHIKIELDNNLDIAFSKYKNDLNYIYFD